MRKAIASFILVSAFALVASASVTFDPSTGIGFVGKGDVQTALGLNNAQMQAQANSLTFTYVTKDTYEVVYAWATGNPDHPVSLSTHQITKTTTVGVNSALAYDPRKGPNQYTGFNLKGLQPNPVIDGVIPTESATVSYVTYTWTTQEWHGQYDIVPDPTKNDPYRTKQVKHYDTVEHVTDQLPAYLDENGTLVLYSEGDNKAVLSVTKLDSVGQLFVNGALLVQ